MQTATVKERNINEINRQIDRQTNTQKTDSPKDRNIMISCTTRQRQTNRQREITMKLIERQTDKHKDRNIMTSCATRQREKNRERDRQTDRERGSEIDKEMLK